MGTFSRGRFIRAAERVTAFKPTDSETAVRIAFDILQDAAGQKMKPLSPPPCWSLVFDTENLRVHFRTIICSDIRAVDFRKLDFSCQTSAKMLDINENLAGDISNRLRDYSLPWHLEHAVMAGKNWKLAMSPDELRELFQSYEKWPCQ